jgi:hypothetical protein
MTDRGLPWFPAIGIVLAVATGACGGDRHEASRIPPTQGTLDAAPPSPASTMPDGASASSGPARESESPLPDCRLCFGKLTPELQAELTHRAGAARRCYDLALGRNQSAQGRIVVRVRVGQTGNICNEKILKDEIRDSELTACAAKAFEGENSPLPAPAGGCMDITVPLRFVPSDAGLDAAR